MPIPARISKAIFASKPIRAINAFSTGIDRYITRFSDWLFRQLLLLWSLILKWVVPVILTILRKLAAAGKWLLKIVAPPTLRILQFLPWSCRLSILTTASAAVTIAIWRADANGLLYELVGLEPYQYNRLPYVETMRFFDGLLFGIQVVVGLQVLAALTAFIRLKISLWLQKAAAAAYFVALITVLTKVSWRIPTLLQEMDSEGFPSEMRDNLWIHGTQPLLLPLALALIWMFLLTLRAVSNYYARREDTAPALGDRILHNLKTHGGDPLYRKSLYTSAAIHIFVIFILPFIFLPGGCERPYEVPQGSGTAALQIVKVRKVKKKPQKKYILNMNTAISFYVPKLEDSEVFEEVDKLTEDTYTAQQVGALGAGGGTKGGWPNGMENARVRFIRLEYDGGDWDQDMGFGADYNMLLKFHEITGFNIWNKTESIRIPQLLRFPKNRAPPFIYITGGLKGGMNVSASEIKVIRKYCLELNGMLFADNGGGNFDRGFRSLLHRAFPELPVIDISNDDILYKQPFVFPDGAPPLWHHSGRRGLGVKYNGRWIVFYHQGDINDAWKDGHSGASDQVAANAYKLGINIIYYSFCQYMALNFAGVVPK